MACVGCTSCGTEGSSAKVGGCNSNGCGSGGCNRLNTFDWLSFTEVPDVETFDIVEVSFKNGSRKEFFRNPDHNQTITGDMVVVETGNGYDIGKISLSGDLVRMQMKKKKIADHDIMHFVLRKANERDLDRLIEAREAEKETMVKARVIARTLDLNMKIGDVEYQGDKRKATFYYIADGRVDFRELIRHYAKEFRVKIEMRQIGARQESARIGGIGSCGRELCCSTWLSDFKSVSTAAARYQNLAINQAKLSGMCGRLKCCLNYELDTYLDALEGFPKGVDKIKTQKGSAMLVKTDIFKGLMFYVYEHERGRGEFYPLKLKRVKHIQRMNKAGEFPLDLLESKLTVEEVAVDYGDVTGAVELPAEKRRSKRNRGGSSKQKDKPIKMDSEALQKAKISDSNELMSKPINKADAVAKNEDKASTQRDEKRPSREDRRGGKRKERKGEGKPHVKNEAKENLGSKNERPKSDAPTNEKIKNERPKSDTPKNEKLKNERPKSDTPKNEKLKNEAPKSEAPKNEAPKSEKLKNEPPKKDASIDSNVPTSQEPKTEGATEQKNSRNRPFNKSRGRGKKSSRKNNPTQGDHKPTDGNNPKHGDNHRRTNHRNNNDQGNK